MTTTTTALKRTALHGQHAGLGAFFTDFGGWEMPLKYSSELAEHAAVRTAAGVFDLSHMGEVRVSGPQAATFLNTALVGNFAAMSVGRAKYSLMCTAEGGIVDDLIGYRLAEDEYLLVPNAGNAPTVAAEFTERAAGFDVAVVDESVGTALVAIQGPASVAVLRALVPTDEQSLVTDMKNYTFGTAEVGGLPVLLARTGYTGEDGFELYLPESDAETLWETLLAAGEQHGLVPCGLACRDSLRLEAGMPLYGQELSPTRDPLSAGLGAVVSFKKEEDFVGRAPLATLREQGTPRRLVGLQGLGRRSARSHYLVIKDGTVVGEVTSGAPSPTLGYPIALAYVDAELAEPGATVEVDVRGKAEPFRVVALPFYHRPA